MLETLACLKKPFPTLIICRFRFDGGPQFLDLLLHPCERGWPCLSYFSSWKHFAELKIFIFNTETLYGCKGTQLKLILMIRLMSIDEWHCKEHWTFPCVTLGYFFLLFTLVSFELPVLVMCSCEVPFLYLSWQIPASVNYLRGETSKAFTLHPPSSGLCKWEEV